MVKFFYLFIYLFIFFFKYKVGKMAQSLLKHYSHCWTFNIDADHQNYYLFTNKDHFSSPLWGLIGVKAKFDE